MVVHHCGTAVTLPLTAFAEDGANAVKDGVSAVRRQGNYSVATGNALWHCMHAELTQNLATATGPQASRRRNPRSAAKHTPKGTLTTAIGKGTWQKAARQQPCGHTLHLSAIPLWQWVYTPRRKVVNLPP